MTPDEFRKVLRCHAAGVVIITAGGDSPVGFTATSFTSVSLRPPVVSFCVDLGGSSWPTIATARYVGVHVLDESQTTLARTFATRGIDKFATARTWRTDQDGLPVLDGVRAVLTCRVIDRVIVGDHAIVLAEPVRGEFATSSSGPLVYYMGRYAADPVSR